MKPTKRRSPKREKPLLLVTAGEGWAIRLDPTTRDYLAEVGGEVVGYRESATAARALIDELRYEAARLAA